MPTLVAVSTTAALPAFSILDLVPVSSGSTSGAALRNSLELARRVDGLGYLRYWVAEHHNMPGIASSSPAVLIGHLASVTTQMRIGSGGVMLPNHSSLAIAEQFGMLEALHPGRIDLGVGRAPGTDPLTARALRRELSERPDDFLDQFSDLVHYFTGEFPAGHPYRHIAAVPAAGNMPSMWLLGSSDYSARVAGLLGLPFSFAHHFSAANTEAALAVYRHSFRPSEHLDRPYALIGVSVVCADTDEEARWLAAPGGLAFVRLRQGRPGLFPSPEEAAAHEYSPAERQAVESRNADSVIGSPQTVGARLAALQERVDVDEMMITTMLHDPADRIRSYELVAGLQDLLATPTQ